MARRGHDLNATGSSARLASLLPQHAQTLTVDADGRPVAARLPYTLVAWLVGGMLTLEPAVLPLAVYMYIAIFFEVGRPEVTSADSLT